MNALLMKVSENIPSDCATYDTIRKKSITSIEELNALKYDVSAYEAYRNDIEFVNSFTEQVLIDEAKYFNEKYGTKVYNYLKTQREQYREKNADLIKAAGCNNNCPISLKCSDISGCTDISGSKCTGTGNGGTDKTGFISYLQKQLNMQSPETVYKKIEYRDEAHELLSTLNSLLTVLYFAVFFIMIVILIVTKKLMIRERFILYLFLFLLPFLFPYFYDFMKYLFFMVFPSQQSHGPKNAFLENKDVRIDSYNI